MTLDVVCHIGLHKTASGTLQRQFFPSCADLALFTTQQRHTGDFIRRVTRQDPQYFDGNAARRLLLPHMTPEHANLISNESLSGPPYAGLIEYGLDHRSPVLLNLQAAFPEARILIVLRRQDGLARSLYRQYLKRGGTASIDRFYGFSKNGKPALMSLDRFRYSTYLQYITELFPSGLKILLFEDFVASRDNFLAELCAFIGINCPRVTLKIENATRLGPVGMELSRWANHGFRSMINNGPLPQIPRKQFGRWRLVSPVEYLHDYWPGSGRASKLVTSISQKILQDVAQDNESADQLFNLGLQRKGYY